MDDGNHTPDAPFRNGITGKYKLLIRNVTPKFGSYEYELVDADGKEYKAVAKEHYTDGDLLRCMVNFEVVNARLVVLGTTLCKKQDLATQIPGIRKTTSIVKPATQSKSATNPAKSNSLFVLLDELQDNGHKTGPMTEAEIQNILKQIEQKRDKRNGKYHCCGATYHTLFDFRKHLFECHKDEYHRYFVKELHQTAPHVIRGVGVSVSSSPTKKKGAARREDSSPTRVKGEYFHLIYTPMGNKR